MTDARNALYDEIRHSVAAEVVDRLDDDMVSEMAAKYAAGDDLDQLTQRFVLDLFQRDGELTAPARKDDAA